MKIRLALLLTLFFSVASVAPSFAAGERYALVIGNAKYPDAEAPLKEPINDARDIAEELKRDGFNVDIGENLTGEQMRRAFERLYGKIKPGSVALIFFSGFGVQSSRQSYMIPVDAQIWTEPDVRRDGFSLETVLGEINSRGAGVKIALIDASRRNPFERRFRSFSAGLAPVIAPNGTLVMYSAALSSVDFRQWQRPQPVRERAAEGNPHPRSDGGGNAEPHPCRRHPRLAPANRCRGFRRRWPRISPSSPAAQARGRRARRRLRWPRRLHAPPGCLPPRRACAPAGGGTGPSASAAAGAAKTG